MTFGYDADIVHALAIAGSNTLRDHGKSFAHELAMRRKRTGAGGLVIEQALLVCRGEAHSYFKSILSSTFGILFLGTPHAGSGKADLMKPLASLAKVLRASNSAIVGVLKPGSEMLANLQQEFHGMLEDRRRNDNNLIEIFCFYEELEVEGIGKIVPNYSAILNNYGNRSIHGNHMQMTRFSGKTDQGYVAVSDQLWAWVETIESRSLPEPATPVTNHRKHKTIESSGGPIFLGNAAAGRDFNISTQMHGFYPSKGE
ncbi:hypothetical protein N7509_007464 [Penicillium cosmopolitanum]|uniref:DUF676 domain-containing protein n=1 Tax=Penicillium cosmopolitanum TaxID=1131564 RepID=A0A9W9VYX2_9EURO|nr:uncharacterized protein N7509_007464 [Penicillium cosmopolitanum]KAJ5391974.1 hypothetical protein N7509_007464 [Penicillium cosmopolitanum]